MNVFRIPSSKCLSLRHERNGISVKPVLKYNSSRSSSCSPCNRARSLPRLRTRLSEDDDMIHSSILAQMVHFSRTHLPFEYLCIFLRCTVWSPRTLILSTESGAVVVQLQISSLAPVLHFRQRPIELFSLGVKKHSEARHNECG